MAEYRQVRNALEPRAFIGLRDALLNSPFVAKSTLGGTFEASRGFGVTFTTQGRDDVVRHIPELAAFFSRVIDQPAEPSLQPFWRRAPLPVPNAWYMNLLLVGTGGGVGAHIDATLAGPAQAPGTTPRVVSVLYLQVPSGGGGELVLARGDSFVGAIRPKERTLLHFRGDLTHQVRPLARDGVRASLVLEQYALPVKALERLPAIRIESRAKFNLALDEAARRGKLDFDLEPR